MTPKSARNIKTPKKKPSEEKSLASKSEKTHHLKPRSPRKSPRSLTRCLLSSTLSSLNIHPSLNLDTSIPATHFQLYISLPASIRGKIWRLAFPKPPLKYTIPRQLTNTPTTTRPSFPKVKHCKLQNFDLFPHLPKDIRIAIWSFILPPPRVHKLRLVRTQGKPGTPIHAYHSSPTPFSKDQCAWISEVAGNHVVLDQGNRPSVYSSSSNHGEGAGPPVTLFVCRESRAFTLGVYTCSTIFEPWRSWAAQTWGWRRVWFHRSDAIYASSHEWRFIESQNSYNISPGKLEKGVVRRLIVQMRMRNPKRDEWERLEGEDAPTPEQVLKAAEDDCEEQIVSVLQSWGTHGGQGLRELSLAIDGRFRNAFNAMNTSRPDDQFVDPLVRDAFIEGGRDIFLKMFDRMVGRVREEHPELVMPRCNVKLITNGPRKNARMQWDYQHGRASDVYVLEDEDRAIDV